MNDSHKNRKSDNRTLNAIRAMLIPLGVLVVLGLFHFELFAFPHTARADVPVYSPVPGDNGVPGDTYSGAGESGGGGGSSGGGGCGSDGGGSCGQS